MSTNHPWHNRLAALTFIVATLIGAGACEDEKDDPLYQSCDIVVAELDTCMNQTYEGCEDCTTKCADRGHDIARQDEHCGELYAATYACIAALSCEDFLKWYSHPDPKLPFPCQAEETAFRTDCPDFDLYNENN